MKIPHRFSQPIKIGNLTLPNAIVYAPLAGYSDLPFRMMSRTYFCGLIFCEMVKMEPLVRKVANAYQMLDYTPEMHPIGAQICGSSPKLAGLSAKIIEDLGFDVIDLNCGCPVDKVTKDGSGSGLLHSPELIGEIIAEMVAAVKIPVTLKVRSGWDDNAITAPEIIRIAEAAGAKAVFVHGRTREQSYRGRASRPVIAECKRQAKNIPVFGNGDLFDPTDPFLMGEETACDGVLIARGTMGNPWIAQQILDQLEGNTVQEKSGEEYCQALSAHVRALFAYYPERTAALHFRRIGCWYVAEAHGARSFRKDACRTETEKDVWDLINKWDWTNMDTRSGKKKDLGEDASPQSWTSLEISKKRNRHLD